MISAKEVINQYHSEKKSDFDKDMVSIEALIIIAARNNHRECSYDILTVDYSKAMNNLKELGYKVQTKTNFNNQITNLIISW